MSTKIMDYKNRINTLVDRSESLLNDDEADFGEYQAFFTFHNETRADLIEETEGEEELQEAFKKIPDIEEEFDKNNSFFVFLRNFFSNKDYRIAIAKKVVESIAKIYEEVIQFLTSKMDVA